MTTANAVVLLGDQAVRHSATDGHARAEAVRVPVPQRGANTVIIDIAALAGTVLAPLFLLAPLSSGGWDSYTQLSFTGRDVVFIALGGEPLVGDPDDPRTRREWIQLLAGRHRAEGPRLVNHQRWWINARRGWEIEYKFTLSGQPDIWALAIDTLAAVAGNQLPGWIPEHGNNGGFEQWNFLNHVYAGRHYDGHVAFIPAVNGSWIIRRKRGDNPVIRREELHDGVDLGATPDLAAVVIERFGFTPTWSGCYRRVRYNVLLESLHTGHVFSIMFDWCTDTAGHVEPLYQVEVEYVRSRALRVTEDTEAALMADFGELIEFTKRVLRDHGVAAAEDHRSKLTWLRSESNFQPP